MARPHISRFALCELSWRTRIRFGSGPLAQPPSQPAAVATTPELAQTTLTGNTYGNAVRPTRPASAF